MRGPDGGVRVVIHSTSGSRLTTGPRSSSSGIAIQTRVGAGRRAPSQAKTCSHTFRDSAAVGAGLRRASVRSPFFASAGVTPAHASNSDRVGMSVEPRQPTTALGDPAHQRRDCRRRQQDEARDCLPCRDRRHGSRAVQRIRSLLHFFHAGQRAKGQPGPPRRRP